MSAIPETFKEICESVLDEADGRGVQIDSVALGRDTNGDLYLTEPTHRNVVVWVAEEYQRIQLENPLRETLHKRGVFLNITATRASYKKSGVRRVDERSLYFIKSGSTNHHPLIVESYDWWQYQEQDGITASAPIPTTIINGPGDEWILWPTPSAAGTVNGDWQIDPDELINADDTPCWDKKFNPMLKWGVLELYAAEFLSEKSAPKLQARARRMLAPIKDAFESEYLSPVRGCPTFM